MFADVVRILRCAGVISEADGAAVKTAGKTPSSGYPGSREERNNKSMQAKPDDTQRVIYSSSIVSIILLLRRLRQSQRVLNTKLGCNTE